MVQSVLIGVLAAGAVAAVALPLWSRARRAATRGTPGAAPPVRSARGDAPVARRTSQAAHPARRAAAESTPAVGMHVVRALALDLERCLTAPPVEALPQPVGGDPRQLAAARAAVQAVGEGLAVRRGLLDALSRVGQDPRELTGLIQSDPEVARRILRRVNGPDYQLDTPIEQITRAAVFLGHTEMRLLAWRACLDDVIRPSSSMTAGAFERQWQHAFTIARTAQALCANAGLVRPETIVIAGLLHDVGKLLALARRPDHARAFDQVRFSTGPALANEIARLGISHPQLGADLCDALGLPAEVGRIVLRHHLPSYAPASAGDAQPAALATVHLADVLSHAAQAHLTGIACAEVYPPAAGWLELFKVGSLDELFSQNVVLALLGPAVAWRGAPGLNSAA